VQPGETLTRIALRYQVPLEQIAEQNALADPDRIHAGQNLVIRPAPPGEVVIAPGATLTEYAERHGRTVADLLALNPQITDPDRIVAGGRLRIA
jgi:LysM repeat protein